LEYLKDHVSSQEDGRYAVALPRKDPTPVFNLSRLQAMRRHLQNESSLTKKGKWQDFMKQSKSMVIWDTLSLF